MYMYMYSPRAPACVGARTLVAIHDAMMCYVYIPCGAVALFTASQPRRRIVAQTPTSSFPCSGTRPCSPHKLLHAVVVGIMLVPSLSDAALVLDPSLGIHHVRDVKSCLIIEGYTATLNLSIKACEDCNGRATIQVNDDVGVRC